MAGENTSLLEAGREAERRARSELRWTTSLDYALMETVLAGADVDDVLKYVRNQYHRTVRLLADMKLAAMREMAQKRTKGETR